jgi:hypothetical protein
LPETELIRCDDYQPLETTTRTFVDGSKKKTSIFPYSDKQRVYRLDFLDENTKKQVYLQYLLDDGSWQLGNGLNTWQIYSRGLNLDSPGNTVLFLEGEKCVEFSKEILGIAAVTAASPCYSYDYLYKILFVFFAKNKNIKQLVCVPDHDDPGYLKMEKVQKVCHYIKKPCQVISVKQFLNLSYEPHKGADIADFNLKPSIL